MSDIDTPYFLNYKVSMTLPQKLTWLWAIFVIAACQAFPAPIPTAIPSITPGGPTLTPTATITPTPLPTLPPVVRIDAGDQALFYGDYDSARDQERRVG